MPGWSDIKPGAIAAQLPIVWSYKYNAQSGEFVGRLAGQQITSVLSRPFAGTSLAEIFAAEDFGWIYPTFRRVVTEPAFYLGTGRVFRHLNRYGKGERIMMPLAADGVAVDGILGATEYAMDAVEAIDPNEPARETMRWFTLD